MAMGWKLPVCILVGLLLTMVLGRVFHLGPGACLVLGIVLGFAGAQLAILWERRGR